MTAPQPDAAPRDILAMNAFDPGAARPKGLLARRMANAGAASVLFYRAPIQMVRAQGAWMEAADGRRYLDFYNNVPSVGHCHPAVAEAVARQSALLTTNTRYLVEIVEDYAEALKATLPAELSNVLMLCSGSEANDLALRVARAATGGSGVVVTETAYHGNTTAVTEVSPSSWRRGGAPAHVRLVPAPSRARFGAEVEAGFARAVAEAFADLAAAGHPPAALLADTIFSSDGVHPGPEGFLAAAVAETRAAGALFIADEVQPGFGRTGRMWGFARHGIVPDLVTMGKPMGNGFPMAGLAARPDLLDRFAKDTGYFNTFGGNPVAAAAGLAVLRVLADEGLAANAARQGDRLLARLAAAAQADPRLAEVRGAGLFLGAEFRDAAGRPDPATATRMIDAMKDRGVLIGAAGRHGETLKLRPPLCLSDAEADRFSEAFADALAAL